MNGLFAPHIDRHEANAAKWNSQGKPDYAEGSLRKAAKWRRRQREFEMVVRGAFPKTGLDKLMDERLNAIEANITDGFDRMLFGVLRP